MLPQPAGKTDFAFEEDAQEVRIRTDALLLRIERQPLRLSLARVDAGAVIPLWRELQPLDLDPAHGRFLRIEDLRAHAEGAAGYPHHAGALIGRALLTLHLGHPMVSSIRPGCRRSHPRRDRLAIRRNPECAPRARLGPAPSRATRGLSRRPGPMPD